MNTLSEHDRKLAQTLKSLSLEPSRPGPKRRWKISVWIAGAVLVTVVPVAIGITVPGSLMHLKEALLLQLGPTRQDQSDVEAAVPTTENEKLLPTVASPTQAVSREIAGSGYVVAPRSTTVFSRHEGTVVGIAVEVGDKVQAGQIVATIEDTTAGLALDQAKVAKVSSALVLAEREIAVAQALTALRRSEALALRSAISQKDLEDAQAALKIARNLVEQGHQDLVRADIAIRSAAEKVGELSIRVPFAGTVTNLNAHIGDTVLARADSVRESQSILTLTDTGRLVIDADIAETNLALLRPGLRGEAVLDGFPDQPFVIELRRVAPTASIEKGTIGIRLSLSNPPAGIRPNMAARIRITIPENHHTPTKETQP